MTGVACCCAMMGTAYSNRAFILTQRVSYVASPGARYLMRMQVARQSPHKEYLKALLKEAKTSSNNQTSQVGDWAYKTLFTT